jgi:ADP-L-glycero-D-manno-heptose 6-epimerase
MLVITGAAGFIGWNLYQSFRHVRDIILVDYTHRFNDLSPTHNIMDPFDFLEKMKTASFASKIEAIFHQGACSDTLSNNPLRMMHQNFDYSHNLFGQCLKHGVKLIYASSASVYGDGTALEGAPTMPKNLYANSKRIFDDYVGAFLSSTEPQNHPQIVGLRYFNVYGPGEERKGRMASVACQFKKQIDESGEIKIFAGSENFMRDFIFIDDVVKINQHFINNPKISGIFNCGTGIATPFTAIPEAMKAHYDFDIIEIPMPENIISSYQRFTKADTNKLNTIGQYTKPFLGLNDGMKKYVEYWEQQ